MEFTVMKQSSFQGRIEFSTPHQGWKEGWTSPRQTLSFDFVIVRRLLCHTPFVITALSLMKLGMNFRSTDCPT